MTGELNGGSTGQVVHVSLHSRSLSDDGKAADCHSSFQELGHWIPVYNERIIVVNG